MTKLVPVAVEPRGGLSSRWYALRPVTAQLGYVRSRHRFNVVPAGRRSGKTERFKRKVVRRAMAAHRLAHGQPARFFAGAPTRLQAKQIFWDDLKRMTEGFQLGKPSESELTIRLLNGASIVVVGLDRPERIEGQPWDGGGIDEIANVKPDAWKLNVRPALSDRNGWCDLIGVPEGRNHYFELYQSARAELLERGDKSEWGAFTWLSSAVLPAHEIEAARRDLDPLSFQQEYEASFVNFTGRAYYSFTDDNLARLRDRYNPNAPLVFCYDFNVAPGVAVVCQIVRMEAGFTAPPVVAVLGEVWIPDNSNTELVTRKLVTDWGLHAGAVEVYGDATGGARKTSGVSGSDWDLVRRDLRGHFGSRVSFHVPPANPSERGRVNAMNSRLLTADGRRLLLVDPIRAPRLVKDLEGVQVLEGGSGEIDKRKDRSLTHISDALGYYIAARFPVSQAGVTMTTLTV